LDDFSNTQTDPLLNLTSGIAIEGNGLVNESDTSLISKKPSDHFQINIYPLTKIGTVASWKNAVLEKYSSYKKIILKGS
jgi:hypothetical protein